MSLPPPTNSEINSNNYISSANSIFDDGLDEEYRVFLSQLLSDEIEGDEEGEEGEYQPENKEETLDDDDSESDDDGDEGEGEDGSVDDEPEDDDNMSGLMRVAKNEVRDLVDECWKTMLGEAPQVPALDASNQSRPYHHHEHTNDHPHQPSSSTDYNYTHHNNTYNNDYIESDILSTSSYDSQDEYQTRNFRASSTDSHPHDHNTENIYSTNTNNNNSSQTFANKRKYIKSNKNTRNNKDNTTNNNTANNTSYISKIMRQMMSSESKPSDICVDGYPVNAYRRILARQWHMVSQLLLQLLILTQSAVIEDGENQKKGHNYDRCKEFYERIYNNKSKSIKRAALMRMNVENLLLAKGVSTSDNLPQYNTPGLQRHATPEGWVPGMDEPTSYYNPAWDGHTLTQSSPVLFNDTGDNSFFGQNHQNYDPLSSHSPGNSFPHSSPGTYQHHQHYNSNTDPTINTTCTSDSTSLHIYDRKLTRLQAIKKQTRRYNNKLHNATTIDDYNNSNNNNAQWQASLDLPILKYNNTNDLLEKIKQTILTCHLESSNIDNQPHIDNSNTHTNTLLPPSYTTNSSSNNYSNNVLNLHKLKHYLTIICTTEQWPIRNCLLPTETYPLSTSVVSLYYTNKAASDFNNEFLKSLSALPPLPPLPPLSTLPHQQPLTLQPPSDMSCQAYDDQGQQLSGTGSTSVAALVDGINLTSGTGGGDLTQYSGYTQGQQGVEGMFTALPELAGYLPLTSYPTLDQSCTDPLALPTLTTYSSLLPFTSQPDYTAYMNAFMNPALYSSLPFDPITYTPPAPIAEPFPTYPTTTAATTATTGDTRYACAVGFGDSGATDLTSQPTAVIPWLQSYISAMPSLSSLTGAYDFDMLYFTPAEEVSNVIDVCMCHMIVYLRAKVYDYITIISHTLTISICIICINYFLFDPLLYRIYCYEALVYGGITTGRK